MPNPLANPLQEMEGPAGDEPAWFWKVGGAVAGIAGAVGARRVLEKIRVGAAVRRGTPREQAETMDWPAALAWTAVVGIAGALGKLLAQRLVARAWWHERTNPA